MPLFGMDTQQQVVNRFVCSCSSWYDLRGRGKCNKYRLKILNIRCRAMIGSVHWRVKGLNNLVYWYQYNTLLAWCKPMEEFGDIPRYWESNISRKCSRRWRKKQVDRFSTCRDIERWNMTGYIKGMRSPKCSVDMYVFFVCGVQLQVVDGFSSSCRVW